MIGHWWQRNVWGRWVAFSMLAIVAWFPVRPVWGQAAPATQDQIRIATFNTSLYRDAAGELAAELAGGQCEQAKSLASILQTVRPDIVLLNEIDYTADQSAVRRFVEEYLQVAQDETLQPLAYPHIFSGPVNTGVDSGLDLNRDEKLHGPADAYGFGRYEGQYGMSLLSRFPIDTQRVRTFQKLLWHQLDGALRPVHPKTKQSYYDDAVWQKLRLSSKSHWDVPVRIGDRTLHVLACHPTPPAFDGAEDRNGCRNHDEIRFWLDYLNPAVELEDDNGVAAGLPADASFVIVGDLNADPIDGSGRSEAIRKLVQHPRIRDPLPESEGAAAAAERLAGKNLTQKSDPARDTAQFSPRGVGNLRVDYCLPSVDLNLRGSGVFWPLQSDSRAKWLTATDHRLVWVDVSFDGS